MSYKLICVKKLKENPDILEIEYNNISWTKKGRYQTPETKKIYQNKHSDFWYDLSTGEYLGKELSNALNAINKHLKLNETYII
jgi:hypothetical protein